MVYLTYEDSLLQKIDDLDAISKIQNSVGLTSDDVRQKVKQLIPTTKQRLNAAKFYLDSMGNIDYATCLKNKSSRLAEQKPPFVFSNEDIKGEISLLNQDALPSIVFLILNEDQNPNIESLKLEPETLTLIIFLIVSGFLSQLVSTEDSLTKIINIVYDLIPYNKRYLGSDIRKELKNRIPNGQLIRYMQTFHPITRINGKYVENIKGSFFNIAKQIRNHLTHDDITDIIEFPPINYRLSGFVDDSDLNLYFQNSFFPTNTVLVNTEVTTFCNNVFFETLGFIDECYKLIHSKLQSRGCIPV